MPDVDDTLGDVPMNTCCGFVGWKTVKFAIPEGTMKATTVEFDGTVACPRIKVTGRSPGCN